MSPARGVVSDLVVGRDIRGRVRARTQDPAARPRIRVWRPARPPRRALIVHPWGLGDWLFFEPAFRSLRGAWPGTAWDVYLHQPSAAPLVEAVGGVARIVPRPPTRAGLLGVIADLRRQRYDLALATSTWRVWKARAFLHATGARAKVAEWRRTPVGLAGGVRASWALHMVEANLAIAAAAGGAPVDPRTPRFPVRAADAAAAEQWIVQHGLDAARLAFFHPGGAKRYIYKRWPLERFAEVASALAAQGFAPVAILGPDEPDLEPAVRAFAAAPAIARGLPLGTVAALLARAAIYFGADTFLAHLAAAVGAPTVAVLGPNVPGRTAPYGPNAVHVVHGGLPCQPCWPGRPAGCPEMTCMRDVGAGQVLAAIELVSATVRGDRR